MLEKPDLQDKKIITCLQNEFGLSITQIHFLSLGYDQNTAVYRAITHDNLTYFVKLRRGKLDKASVEIPIYLFSLGIQQVIPPYELLSGQLWTNLEPYHLILFPYIDGQNGYEAGIKPFHWVELGQVLKRFHTVKFPGGITNDIRRERFSTLWRDSMTTLLKRIETGSFAEPIAVETAAFMLE